MPGISSVLGEPVHHCTRGGVRVSSRDPGPGDGRMSAARRACVRSAGRPAVPERPWHAPLPTPAAVSLPPSLPSPPGPADRSWPYLPYLGIDPSTHSTYSPQQLLPSTLAGAYFWSVSRQWGVDRRPKDVCERGMVSCIRIIVTHFLGPNNLWDIIKIRHFASVLRPPPAKPWRRLYCQCEPSATIVGRKNHEAKHCHVVSSTRYKVTHP